MSAIPHAIMAHTAHAFPPAPAKALRCLYADDMDELHDLLQLVLAPDGHTVEGAANGREALARIAGADAAYDVIVTDHHMPELNGLGLVQALRSLDYHGKVVVFTSELSPEVNAAYRELNVDHVLPKPVLPPVLRELFRNL